MERLDVDAQRVITTLRRAVEDSGLSLRQFASAMGTSSARYSSYCLGRSSPSAEFVFRAERVGAGLGTAHRLGVPTPVHAARSLERAQQYEDEGATIRVVCEIRDRLEDTVLHRPAALDAWDARPRQGQVSDRWWVLNAALVARCLTYHGRPVPAWAGEPRLEHPWTLESLRYTPEQVRSRTPEWLAERNVFATPHDLSTVKSRCMGPVPREPITSVEDPG